MSEVARAAAGESEHAAAGHRFHGYLSLQSRGVVALPPALRRRYGLDQPGAQVEVTEREDGVLEVRPVVAVPASEAWFWTSRWQAGEREVDAHLAAGNVTVSASPEDFLTDLEDLDARATRDESASGEEVAGGDASEVGPVGS